MKSKYLIYTVLLFTLTACSGAKESSNSSTSVKDAPAPTSTQVTTPTPTVTPTPAGPDLTAPALVIVSPNASGQTFGSTTINITGSASDASGIQSVTVNGVLATGTTSWSKSVTLVSGSNSFAVVATDNSPAKNKKTTTITAIYEAPAAGAPSAPTSLALLSPANNVGLIKDIVITVGGVTSGNNVYLYYNDSACVSVRASAVATGSSVNINFSNFHYQTNIFYAKQVTQQGISSPCSTATVSYLYGISAPTSLTMFNPTANSGMIAKPTITVNGISSGNSALLYSDSNCTTNVGGGISTGTSVNTPTASLPAGSTTFYAKQYYIDTVTNYSYYSACSTASVTYTYLVPDAPTTLTMYIPQSTTGTSANPIISFGGILEGNTVSLYSNSTCTTLRGTTLVVNGAAAITSSTIPLGATSFYAKQTRPDGSASLCSTASVSYTYTGVASPVPTQVVVQAAAGIETSCAIVAGGKLKCWGKNASGELKNGTTTPSSVPVDIPGFESGVTAVGNGSGNICAIQSGVLKCWGTNFSVSALMAINSSTDTFVKLALTNAHVCAITSNGALRCFGRNYGFETVTTGLDSGVTAVSVSNTFSCAVQNGALKCWGCNYSDRTALGIGTPNGDTCNLPTQVTGLESGVTAVSQYDEQSTCAIQNGALKCWGVSFSGLPASPTVIPGFESGVTYTQGKCAIKNNEYKCFSSFGVVAGVVDLQLVKIGNFGVYNYTLGIFGVKASAENHFTNNAHSCYVFNSGDLKCMGGNNNGQLGNGTAVNSGTMVSPVGFAAP